MDLKNQDKAKVFKYEDPKAWSLTYIENGGKEQNQGLKHGTEQGELNEDYCKRPVIAAYTVCTWLNT